LPKGTCLSALKGTGLFRKQAAGTKTPPERKKKKVANLGIAGTPNGGRIESKGVKKKWGGSAGKGEASLQNPSRVSGSQGSSVLEQSGDKEKKKKTTTSAHKRKRVTPKGDKGSYQKEGEKRRKGSEGFQNKKRVWKESLKTHRLCSMGVCGKSPSFRRLCFTRIGRADRRLLKSLMGGGDGGRKREVRDQELEVIRKPLTLVICLH